MNFLIITLIIIFICAVNFILEECTNYIDISKLKVGDELYYKISFNEYYIDPDTVQTYIAKILELNENTIKYELCHKNTMSYTIIEETYSKFKQTKWRLYKYGNSES